MSNVNTEISKILRDIASEMERRSTDGVAQGSSTSTPTLSRHPVDAEVCRIFAPYAGRTSGSHCTTAKRRSSYTRSYFCLDSIDQIMVPTKVEKEKLYAAGLGEKKLTFFGDENSAEEFKCHILTAYPKLNSCGGFELLRLSGMTRSKKLSVMPCPNTGYTIKSIKDHNKSAIIYIRPMQKDIDTTPVEPESVVSGPKERCLICEEDIFFCELKDHVKSCRSASEISKASTSNYPSDGQEFPNTTDRAEVDIDQSSTDSEIVQFIDLTEGEPMQESLDEWRSLRCQQDQEYQESLLADQEKHNMQKHSLENEERRRKAIHERQLRMADVPEPADGVPLRFKYPSGITRTRKFVLSESIQILFDFVGEDDDATEYFHIQDALSVTTLKSNMTGTLLGNNINGSRTLYIHWIQIDDLEFVPALDSNNQAESPSVSNQFFPMPATSFSLPSSPTFLPETDSSFFHEGTDLKTILNRLGEKIDHTSCPASNHINIYRDYTGNVHNILKSTVQAFKRRKFNPEARLDVIFVDSEQISEGSVDGGGPTREYLRLLMKAIHQSSIFEGPETDKTLALDSQALEGKLYTQIARMISVCAIHGGVAPNFFSERLFNQVCDKPTARATLDEVSDVTFKEKLLKIKEARTVEDAKAAIEEAEDSLAIVGSCRIITTLKQRDALVQSAVNFFVEGRLNVALQQFVEGFTTLGLLKEMRAHPDLFHSMFVKDVRPLKASDLSTLFQVSFSASGTHKRELENQTVCYWRDWLIDVEEGECAPLTLENVLEFASGASTIPPCGFFPQPTIEVFPEELGKIFPEANTCVLVLKLPVHKDYDSFKAQMCNAVLWAPTF
ncbi:uncharacterized protein [Misgurnus anguillicaudatus]|uniref:uncharacterized protein isoform X1 n=1 Tax=Misgurnus anguillicaudatus TaxID=75329 RepID=UPI003CCFD93B